MKKNVNPPAPPTTGSNARRPGVNSPLRDMTASLCAAYGFLMTAKDVMSLLKCGRSTAYEWLADLSAVCVGKRKLYRIEDVARKVLDSMEKKGVVI